ncbi:transglutaminase family protein [Algicola sagamiensis]|uniref:transglutaminase family protein n=1 Tax=Algicola sagamiensis TaxID=163869 RepID=UPI00037053C8|nr:DUF3488 and transglutaminase-like domain-containing protein [Algicola sagamiensis]
MLKIHQNAHTLWGFIICQWMVIYFYMEPVSYATIGLTILLQGWAVAATLNKCPKPGKNFLTVLTIVCALIVIASNISKPIDSFFNLLIIGAVLKLLTPLDETDLKSIFLIHLFLVSGGYVFHQSIGMALLILLAFILTVYLHLSLYTIKSSAKPRMKIAFRVIFYSMPATMLLFVMMPRLPPLWSMFNPGVAKVGVSDNMSPGDISNIVKDDKRVFRVEFNGAVPDQSQLYWRTLILEDFDGRRWSMIPRGSVGKGVEHFSEAPKDGLSYRVIAEPTQQSWAYALDAPLLQKGEGLFVTRHRTLMYKKTLAERKSYEVISYQDPNVRNKFIQDEFYERNLKLPKDYSDVKQFTLDIIGQEKDEKEIINKVLSYITKEGYVYTIQPPLMQDSVRGVLFTYKKGFCAHYASAIAVMMRSIGIPARIVTGYQGGKWNPTGKYLDVSQTQAHAWVEIWSEKYGWLHIDPTGAIAPSRVESSLETALEASGELNEYLGYSPEIYKFTQNKFFTTVSNWMSSVDFYWTAWVLTYDDKKRDSFLDALSDLKNWLSFIKYFIGPLIIFGVLWYAYRRFQKNKHLSVEEKILRYIIHLQKLLDTPREQGVTLAAYIDRLQYVFPEFSDRLKHLERYCTLVLYGTVEIQEKLSALKQVSKQIKALEKDVKQLDS